MQSRIVKQELIPLTSPEEWQEALRDIPHAFGHTWESCHAMYLSTGYATYLYALQYEDTRVVCPIAERTYKGYTDIVTPYGFSGFTGNKALEGFPSYWKDFAASKAYVCGYIGLNPFLQAQRFVESEDLFLQHTLFALDLTLGFEQLFQNLSSNRRRQLKAFDPESPAFCTDKALLKPFFLEHYHRFFAERNASAVYNFSRETLSFLFDLEQVLAVGIIQENKVEAVSLFAFTGTVAEYLFNVSAPGGQVHTASLIWYAVHWLKKKNIPLLNLGGGIKENDSIAEFKMRFGPEIYTLKAAKQVYNKEVFEHLCGEKNSDSNNRNGFFPPYRQPNKMYYK